MKQLSRFALTLYFVCVGLFSSAQEYHVKSFEIRPDDIEARVNSRIGNNGRKCALLKVYVQDSIDHVNGSVIGNIEAKGMEKRIYLAHDSKQVELVFNNHFPLRIKFDDYHIPVVTEQTVYVLYLVEEQSSKSEKEIIVAVNDSVSSSDIILDAINCYQAGSYEQAFSLFMKNHENATAQYYLGIMYENGRGTSKNYDNALKWYRKAADKGYAKAQNNMGGMYYEGRGVAKDYKTAYNWYKKAAEQGDETAQSNLGIMYFNGQGVNKDYNEAASWFHKAAEQGEVRAQNNLGFMYEYGYGVDKDLKEALYWYQMAAQQGHPNAQKALYRLKSY